jgi:CubicO group peptidase (beta-lactamase class C family)
MPLPAPIARPAQVSSRKYLIAATALCLLAACGGDRATACPTGQIALEGRCTDTAQTAAAVRAVVADTIKEFGLRSAVVGVSVGDVPVLMQAWGESGDGQPASVDMHWRNGAIAISYLGTALLQLQDRGLLSVDDKLSKWLPKYPNADRVTLAMLANNTSGYADYVNVLPLMADVHRQWTPDELIASGLGEPLKCEPGTCFSYSHANYVILGRVLSLASGKPVAELIRSGILEPLGLRDTRSEATPAIQTPVLRAFTSERGTYEESTNWNPSWTLAEGAIMTTNTPDVLRSAEAIGSGRLLSPKSYAQMLAPTTAKLPGMPSSIYYGLGVVVANSWLLQNPMFFGYAGTMAYLPAQKIAIAVTSTMGPATPDRNTAQLLFARIAQRLAPSQPPQ